MEFACDLCDKTFSTKQGLTLHKTHKHPGQPKVKQPESVTQKKIRIMYQQVVENPMPITSYPCEHSCGFVHNNIAVLQYHQSICQQLNQQQTTTVQQQQSDDTVCLNIMEIQIKSEVINESFECNNNTTQQLETIQYEPVYICVESEDNTIQPSVKCLGVRSKLIVKPEVVIDYDCIDQMYEESQVYQFYDQRLGGFVLQSRQQMFEQIAKNIDDITIRVMKRNLYSDTVKDIIIEHYITATQQLELQIQQLEPVTGYIELEIEEQLVYTQHIEPVAECLELEGELEIEQQVQQEIELEEVEQEQSDDEEEEDDDYEEDPRFGNCVYCEESVRKEFLMLCCRGLHYVCRDSTTAIIDGVQVQHKTCYKQWNGHTGCFDCNERFTELKNSTRQLRDFEEEEYQNLRKDGGFKMLAQSGRTGPIIHDDEYYIPAKNSHTLSNISQQTLDFILQGC